MYMNERLKRIDDFFKNLSVQEFDEILGKAGINEIKSSSSSNMELLLSATYTTEVDICGYYKNKTEDIVMKKDYYNLYSDDYAKAV